MVKNLDCHDRSTYRVRTGLMQLVVEADSPKQAIEVARRQLCLELPRLWDIIQGLEASDFQVSPDANESQEPASSNATDISSFDRIESQRKDVGSPDNRTRQEAASPIPAPDKVADELGAPTSGPPKSSEPEQEAA